MQEDFRQRLFAPQLGPCVCSQVRKLARKLSSLYDAFLAPAGLTITQFSLLVHIARAGQLGHTLLAEKVGMERTTLTRNLRPLTRAKLVITATGLDRRQHLLQLTAAGKRKLVRSLPLWEKAQRQFLAHIDSELMRDFNDLLGSAESAATKAFTVNQENPKAARLSAERNLLMPLVRIDLIQGRSSDYRKTIGEVVYEAMIENFKVPKNDHFQVITEHPAEGFILGCAHETEIKVR